MFYQLSYEALLEAGQEQVQFIADLKPQIFFWAFFGACLKHEMAKRRIGEMAMARNHGHCALAHISGFPCEHRKRNLFVRKYR